MKDIFAIKKLDLLISLYVFCVMVAELMGNKTFPLGSIGGFPLNASVAIFVIPILFSINDVITEVYGAERTRSVVGAGLIVIICLILFSLLATALVVPLLAASTWAFGKQSAPKQETLIKWRQLA